jgi:hypothetical protein
MTQYPNKSCKRRHSKSKNKQSHAVATDLVPFLTLEDGTDTLSRNVSKGLPFDTA